MLDRGENYKGVIQASSCCNELCIIHVGLHCTAAKEVMELESVIINFIMNSNGLNSLSL